MAIQLLFLTDEDIIEPTDFTRPVDLVLVGHSDVYQFESPYTCKPINHTRWLEVSRAGMPHFIGKSVSEFNNWMRSLEKPHQPTTIYEFIRGDLPESSKLPETDHEKFEKVKDTCYNVGQYKGVKILDVKSSNFGYYQWSVDKNIVPYEMWYLFNKFG